MRPLTGSSIQPSRGHEAAHEIQTLERVFVQLNLNVVQPCAMTAIKALRPFSFFKRARHHRGQAWIAVRFRSPAGFKDKSAKRRHLFLSQRWAIALAALQLRNWTIRGRDQVEGISSLPGKAGPISRELSHPRADCGCQIKPSGLGAKGAPEGEKCCRLLHHQVLITISFAISYRLVTVLLSG